MRSMRLSVEGVAETQTLSKTSTHKTMLKQGPAGPDTEKLQPKPQSPINAMAQGRGDRKTGEKGFSGRKTKPAHCISLKKKRATAPTLPQFALFPK